VLKDHLLVRENFASMTLSKDADTKQRIFNDTIKMLSQHDVAEEMIIYPAARNFSSEGIRLADKAVEDTKVLEQELYKMDQMFGTGNLKQSQTGDFDAHLLKVQNLLFPHVEWEETVLFPFLEKHLAGDDIANLNKYFEMAKVGAPTRPHPDGPHSAAGKLLTGPLVSFMDHIRDLGKKFTTGTTHTTL